MRGVTVTSGWSNLNNFYNTTPPLTTLTSTHSQLLNLMKAKLSYVIIHQSDR